MASLSMLTLTKSFSFLSIHSLPWTICLRGISERSILEKLDFPEKPKKPMGPYLMYLRENRKEFFEKNPNAKATDLVKEYSKIWKNLSTEEKEKYKEEYKKKYEVYQDELKKFFDSLSPSQRNELDQAISEISVIKEKKLIKKVKKEKIREFNKPKAPLNGFTRYMTTLDRSNMRSSEFWKLASKKWKLLSSEERDIYQKQYAEEKLEFLKKLQEWEDEMIQKGHLDLVRTKTIKKMLH